MPESWNIWIPGTIEQQVYSTLSPTECGYKTWTEYMEQLFEDSKLNSNRWTGKAQNSNTTIYTRGKFTFFFFFTAVSPSLNSSHRKQWCMFLPSTPKFICWNPIWWHLEVESLGSGHECGALMNGMDTLIKEAIENTLTPATKKSAIYKPERGPHHTLNLLAPWSLISQSPEEVPPISVYCLLATQSVMVVLFK